MSTSSKSQSKAKIQILDIEVKDHEVVSSGKENFKKSKKSEIEEQLNYFIGRKQFFNTKLECLDPINNEVLEYFKSESKQEKYPFFDEGMPAFPFTMAIQHKVKGTNLIEITSPSVIKSFLEVLVGYASDNKQNALKEINKIKKNNSLRIRRV